MLGRFLARQLNSLWVTPPLQCVVGFSVPQAKISCRWKSSKTIVAFGQSLSVKSWYFSGEMPSSGFRELAHSIGPSVTIECEMADGAYSVGAFLTVLLCRAAPVPGIHSIVEPGGH